MLGGLVTNVGFHRWLIDADPVAAGRVTTRFLDDTEVPSAAALDHAAAVGALRGQRSGRPPWERTTSGPWQRLRSRRITPHRPSVPVTVVGPDGIPVEVGSSAVDAAAVPSVVVVDAATRSVAFVVDGHTQWYRVPTRSDAWPVDDATAAGSGSAVTSPFPASVAEVHVAPGQAVAGGDPLVVVEGLG